MEKFFNESEINNIDIQFYERVFNELNSFSLNGAFFAGFPFLGFNDTNIKVIRGLMICNFGLYIFYRNEKEKSVYQRSVIKTLMNSEITGDLYQNNQNIIKFIDMNKKMDSYYGFISNNNRIIDDNLLRLLIGLFQNIISLVKIDNRKISNNKTIGYSIVERSRLIANFDIKQFNAIYMNNENNICIRGLAGSGKTIVLVKKLAYLHYKYPNMNLAYIFYTKSLKQTIDNFFELFYKEMDSYGKKPDMTRVHIMHAWGGGHKPGLYSELCSRLGINAEIYNPYYIDFESICKDTLVTMKEKNIELKAKYYDYILIDEAQDFGVNFFKLAKACLTLSGRLIYAYDELQVLNSYKSVPSKQEIFNSDETCDDKILSFCYRSPKEIIVTAHALGLGTYHKDKDNKIQFCNVVQSPDVWSAIGYKITSGMLSDNSQVVLERDDVIVNNIENPIKTCIDTQENQILKTIKEIIRLTTEEDVKKEDILIIDLDAMNLSSNYSCFIAIMNAYFSKLKLVDETGKRFFDLNLLNKESSYDFRRPDSVTYTTIFRAKGNEANVVFILNADKTGPYLSYNRNKLFTAITRAKSLVYILGNGNVMQSIANEVKEVKKHKYALEFRYPSAKEILSYKQRISFETESATRFEQFLSEYNKKPDKLKDQYLRYFLENLTDHDKKRIVRLIRGEKDAK